MIIEFTIFLVQTAQYLFKESKRGTTNLRLCYGKQEHKHTWLCSLYMHI